MELFTINEEFVLSNQDALGDIEPIVLLYIWSFFEILSTELILLCFKEKILFFALDLSFKDFTEEDFKVLLCWGTGMLLLFKLTFLILINFWMFFTGLLKKAIVPLNSLSLRGAMTFTGGLIICMLLLLILFVLFKVL